MKKRMAMIAVVLFTMSLFTQFAEAKGCSSGKCGKQQVQKQECEKSGSCEKKGSCDKEGSCEKKNGSCGKEGECDKEKQAGKGQAQASRGQGNGNGYRGGRG